MPWFVCVAGVLTSSLVCTRGKAFGVRDRQTVAIRRQPRHETLGLHGRGTE